MCGPIFYFFWNSISKTQTQFKMSRVALRCKHAFAFILSSLRKTTSFSVGSTNKHMGQQNWHVIVLNKFINDSLSRALHWSNPVITWLRSYRNDRSGRALHKSHPVKSKYLLPSWRYCYVQSTWSVMRYSLKQKSNCLSWEKRNLELLFKISNLILVEWLISRQELQLSTCFAGLCSLIVAEFLERNLFFRKRLSAVQKLVN